MSRAAISYTPMWVAAVEMWGRWGGLGVNQLLRVAYNAQCGFEISPNLHGAYCYRRAPNQVARR